MNYWRWVRAGCGAIMLMLSNWAAPGVFAQHNAESATLAATATPQTPETIVDREDTLTRDKVEQALKQFPAPSGDAPPSREYAALQDALSALDEEQGWQDKLANLKKITSASDADLNDQLIAAQNEAVALASAKLPDNEADAESAQKKLEPQLQDVEGKVSDLQKTIASGPQRRVTQTQRLNDLKKLLNMPASLGDSPADIAAQAEQQAQQAEADFLEFSIATDDSLKTLRNSQLKIAQIRRKALSDWNDRLDNHLQELRDQSLKAQEEAMRASTIAAAKVSPALRKLAELNEELLQRRKQLLQALSSISLRRDYYATRAERINQRLSEIQQRVNITGFSQAAAEIMLKELRGLPHISELESEQAQLERDVREAQLELFDLSADMPADASTNEQIEGLGLDLTREEKQWLEAHVDSPALQQMLAQNRQLVDDLSKDANDYFEALLATDSEIMATLQATQQFRNYASENILWIPSRDMMSVRDARSLPGLFNSAIHDFNSLLNRIFKGTVLRIIVVVALVILLFLGLRHWVIVSRPMRQLPGSRTEFLSTAKWLALEVAIALTPVLTLQLIAWAFNDPKLDGGLSNAIEYTALSAVPATFFLVLLFRITRPQGFARLHLHWRAEACQQLHLAVRRFLFPALFFGVTSIAFDQYAQILDQPSGARLFLLPSFLLCLLALHTAFNPRKGILMTGGVSFFERTKSVRWGIYILLLGWQTFLSLLVVSGYMLGAVMLWGHTFRTLWLIAGILIAKGVIERYLEVQQWCAHQQEREELERGELGESTSFQLDDSTRQVIGFLQWVFLLLGVSAVWSDAFPSIRKLGSQPIITFGDQTMLSLGQGSMLLLCIVTTVLLARSLPRLFEILVLRRLGSIDPGSRHAFSTLMAYLVIMVGVIWASSILLIQWGDIQWLVAAISVGLGFGLQEIFGNLVAGIILLFERPIRVGDIVTVGQTTGKVTRIQMRGTTIMEWDRRELIVPNKEFVTGQLTNWTLSDTLTRVTLNVGVAYGSDISKVKQLLFETINQDPRVLKDPSPAAFFKEFGESSLNFICYAYLGTLDNRLGVTSDLQQAIYETLQAADINIPFPQRDLHIIDAPPGWFGREKAE